MPLPRVHAARGNTTIIARSKRVSKVRYVGCDWDFVHSTHGPGGACSWVRYTVCVDLDVCGKCDCQDTVVVCRELGITKVPCAFPPNTTSMSVISIYLNIMLTRFLISSLSSGVALTLVL
jgi:hypothetical protein